MSPAASPPESSVYMPTPSEGGTDPVLSSASGSIEATGSTISQSSRGKRQEEASHRTKRQKKGPVPSTAESPPLNKKKICSAKSKVCRHPTLGFRYFLTQDRGSTSSVRASKGFFKKSCADISEKLWYPTETDCAELLSTSSSGYVTSTKLNSWFTTKIRRDPTRKSFWRTSWPLPTFSVPGSMESDQISRGNAVQKSAKNVLVMKLLLVQLRILAVRQEQNAHVLTAVVQSVRQRIETIREYGDTTGKLSKTQQKQLDTLGTALHKYNTGSFHGDDSISDLLYHQDELTDQLAKRFVTIDAHLKRAKRVGVRHIDPKSKSKLREYMRASRKIFNKALDGHNKGAKGEALRQTCVRSAHLTEDLKKIPEHVRQKAFDKYKSSQASCDELGGHLAFISRKKDQQWVGLQKRDCKIEGNTLKLFGRVELQLNETLDQGEPDCDLEITESCGIFYVAVQSNLKYDKPPEVDIRSSRFCALDMGERTFGTLYDPDGTIAFLGTDANDRVKKRLRVIYKLRNGLKAKLALWKKRRVLKAIRRASAKLKNLIKEMHNRIASWLVTNYDVVLIGKLGIGVMKCKRKGKRVLQTLSHYSFRRTLLQKASVYQKNVRVVSEAYTTKQCNRCGFINWTIGSNETFSCKNCKVVCHRDVHSGRGIFIRSLGRD